MLVFGRGVNGKTYISNSPVQILIQELIHALRGETLEQNRIIRVFWWTGCLAPNPFDQQRSQWNNISDGQV